jgi:hypothetical protein
MKRMIVALATAALAGLVLALPASSAVSLTPAETAKLQYMREEEKLARDVYKVLGAKWETATIFQRIAASEQRHMDAVKVVLDRYGISDPAAGMGVGEFTDPTLQKLYTQLVADGSRSLEDALGVGVTIEKADIADLEQALAETDNADLEQLYGNLLRGSQNHLRAFTSQIDGTTPAQAGARAGAGHGPAAGQAQGAQLRDGSCSGDGQQARQGSGSGPGSGAGPRKGGGW